ncbi:MAG: OsmC family protein [Bacteroidia bacterium]|nr:OsmC family protein [Bacteroidia bacterium]MDW8015746.1 OsmC family protein [Bacteroidia bacterium]
MKLTLRWAEEGLHLIALTQKGHTLEYDTLPEVGGTDKAARPMEGLLAAMLACFSADVIAILRKKRKTLRHFSIQAEAERQEEHPRIFTRVHIVVTVESPDATAADVERSIELSRDKYCGAMAMFRAAGCQISIDYTLKP